MGACFWVGSLAQTGRRLVRPTAWAASVVGIVAVPYAVAFSLSAPASAPTASASSILASSLHLAALGPATMECDRGEHSMALAISGVILATALLGSLLLHRRRRWTLLLWTAVLTTLLAFGPALAPDAHASWLPLPTGWLLGDAVRFPARLSWSALLCLGVLAALAGTAIERRHGRRARILLVLAALEVLVFVRLPWRQQQLPAEPPEALGQLAGPVLDLVPEAPESVGELDNWISGWICYDQAINGHTSAEDCVAPQIHASDRYRAGRWVSSTLLGGDASAARQALAELGFETVVLHTGLFEAGAADRLAAGLARIGTEIEVPASMERLQVYRLAPASTDAASAKAALDQLPASIATQLGSPEALRVLPVQSLALSLIIDDDVTVQGVEAHLTGLPIEQAMQRVLDSGDSAGDNAGDGVHLARWQGPLPAQTELSLSATWQDQPITLWEGTLYLSADQERIDFRVLPTQPPRAIPVALAPASLAAPVNGWNGFVAILGWSVYLIILGAARFHRKHSF